MMSSPVTIKHPVSMARTNAYQNPALIPLLWYLGAWYINDLISIPIGITSITLNQIVIMIGVLRILANPVHQTGTPAYKRVAKWLIIYNVVTFISLLQAIVVYNYFNANWLSIVANTLWFLVIGRYLSYGLSAQEWKLVVRTLSVGTLIAVAAGYLEYLRGDYLLSTPYGVLTDSFWIRGLHIDKVDFGTSMMIGILIVFGHFQTAVTGDRKIFSMLLILGMGILLILSRSWTSYLGVGIALVFVVTARIEQSRARNISLVAALLVVIGGLIFYLPQNPLYQQVETANVFKYKLQVEQYENYNYRYQSVEASYRYFLENPVFGGGFGRAADISRIILNNPEAPLPHTGFATLMIEQGLLGLIPFLGLLMMLAQLAVQAWKGRLWGENVPVPIRILIIGVGGFLLARYLSYFFYLTLSIYFSWAALMLAAIGPRSRQNTAESAIKE